MNFRGFTRCFWVAGALVLALAPGAFGTSDIPKDFLELRDPFKMPEIASQKSTSTELESFATGDFKLIGTLAGINQYRAMLAAPNGKTYFVREKMAIGQRQGVIRKITEDAVYVREKTKNALGEDENVDVVISLPSDAKQDAATAPLGTGGKDQGW